MKSFRVLALALGSVLCAGLGMAGAQDAPSSISMAGGSYSAGASPAVAGSALYAKQVSADTAPGMYAFTAVDALPNTVKPFTVTTNVAAGIAQRIATVGSAQIFVPTAAGISLSGSNVGWSWSTGAGALFKLPLKSSGTGDWYVMPTVRVLKSSVSNGTGYQPIIGLLFGWGSRTASTQPILSTE